MKDCCSDRKNVVAPTEADTATRLKETNTGNNEQTQQPKVVRRG